MIVSVPIVFDFDGPMRLFFAQLSALFLTTYTIAPDMKYSPCASHKSDPGSFRRQRLANPSLSHLEGKSAENLGNGPYQPSKYASIASWAPLNSPVNFCVFSRKSLVNSGV